MYTRKPTRATAAINLSYTETAGAHGAAKNDVVQDLLDELDTQKSKNEHEKNVLAVAKPHFINCH